MIHNYNCNETSLRNGIHRKQTGDDNDPMKRQKVMTNDLPHTKQQQLRQLRQQQLQRHDERFAPTQRKSRYRRLTCHTNVKSVQRILGIWIIYFCSILLFTINSNDNCNDNKSFDAIAAFIGRLGCVGVYAANTDGNSVDNDNNKVDGYQHLQNGNNLFSKKQYDDAAMEFWKAILFYDSTSEKKYDVQTVFQLYMQCYIVQNKMADGLSFVALESYRRGQTDMGYNYLQQAFDVDPDNVAALAIQKQFNVKIKNSKNSNSQQSNDNSKQGDDNSNTNDSKLYRKNNDLAGKTPEQLYEVASQHFSTKNYEECADIFEISCQQSGYTLGPSCANAVYCRNLIVDWGYNGTQFTKDMERIIAFTQLEVQSHRYIPTTKTTAPTTISNNTHFAWHRATSVHPHMMLGYPIEPMLKRYSAESASFLDEKMARATISPGGSTQIPPLPADMPFNIERMRERFVAEYDSHNSMKNTYKIRIGFVGSGFNSKAVLYLSHDMFRFFNSTEFEIHIFSFGAPDNPLFIQHGMRGVDWRERVVSNVDHFHDCQQFKQNHIDAARFIQEHNIHILIEWDGFARQGERAQGLFALRPAPIQILHQEYLGTSGALYTDYIYTDLITSPISQQYVYTEKLIYMPNHFFSKGHAYQKEVMVPSYVYPPRQRPYKFGTGSPQENRCLSSPNNDIGPRNVSFVFCNFNKLLKSNPETVRSWIRILQNVPDSILCLVENPTSAIPYFRKFIYEAIADVDGDELNARIHFLPWEKNPFDHQARNQDLCNVMLDSHPYNGHTVAQDALYGGVPIVTRSDGVDMSSRVTTSANIVLGLEQLNAYDGTKHYEDIAIRIGNNQNEYNQIRRKLIDTSLQRNPMHPYWDVARYVKNFETGLRMVWKRFLDGLQPDHIMIKESPEAARGTYDDEILANPTEGKKARAQSIRSIQSDEL